MNCDAASSVLIPRFGELIGRIKQAITEGAGRDSRRLGALSVLLWNYLGRTLLRLGALEARRAAGRLRPVGTPPDAEARQRSARAAGPRIPYGPVLLRFNAAHLALALEQIIAEPEMRALLDVAPQAGRLLRPLWRMLSTDKLPAPLRLPPRKRRTKPANASDGSGSVLPEAPAPKPKRPRRTMRDAWWVGPPARRITAGRPLLPDW